jgi:hypothetical protein
VPTLIQKYQEEALKSALKKNYAVLKSALDKYQVDNGERLLANNLKSHELKSILMKYLNVTKDCGWGYSTSDSPCNKLASGYKTYNKKGALYGTLFDDGQLILNDGAFIMLENGGNSNLTFISVDVNGMDKKPNQLGKDLFMFQLMDNGELLPMGAKGTNYYSTNNQYCSNVENVYMNGAACTTKVLRE